MQESFPSKAGEDDGAIEDEEVETTKGKFKARSENESNKNTGSGF